jgi:hypothetical protein
MSLKSDVNVDPAKFDRKNIDQETLDFNQKLIKIWADGPRWYEVRTSLKSQTLFPTIYILITSPAHIHRTHVTPGRRRRIPQTPLGRQNAAPETHCARERRKWLAALT